jgi:hypothetical protein
MTKGIRPALESVFFTFATSSAEKIQARTWMKTAMSCRDAHWGGGGWLPEYRILDLQDGEFPRSHHEDWEQSETDDEAGQSCQIAGPKH